MEIIIYRFLPLFVSTLPKFCLSFFTQMILLGNTFDDDNTLFTLICAWPGKRELILLVPCFLNWEFFLPYYIDVVLTRFLLMDYTISSIIWRCSYLACHHNINSTQELLCQIVLFLTCCVNNFYKLDISSQNDISILPQRKFGLYFSLFITYIVTPQNEFSHHRCTPQWYKADRDLK